MNFVILCVSRPEVYSSVKASGSLGQQVLVCLATGFYPKHAQMEIRRDQTPLPDEQLNSHGIRPNTDRSFQLMKSLQILPSDRSHLSVCGEQSGWGWKDHSNSKEK
uniref:Immunoglobulin C1-set domain-containing protein n=1 Tax=Sinocyclocheilus grahami TaxID=75366 RepID=A0A672L293_SINGR